MEKMRSRTAETLQNRAHELIPGGCHTYAKGDDQFPEQAPPFIVRGSGCHAWGINGKEFIEYGMGLRAVTLGHAFAPVIEAAIRQLSTGINFSRPAPIEVDCAEKFLQLVPTAEMVKFCKDGSLAVDGAVRLARAYTGRDMIAICGDHPFFSTNDWFIGTTDMAAGIPESTRCQVVKFRYNDLKSLETLFEQYPSIGTPNAIIVRMGSFRKVMAFILTPIPSAIVPLRYPGYSPNGPSGTI